MRPRHAVLFAVLFAGAAPAAAQSSCDEPSDAEYTDRVLQARAAVESEDFESARELFQWTVENYDYAVAHFSLARSHHRLGDLDAAQSEYTRFLSAFEGCNDPLDLRTSARDYRSLAIRQQAVQLAEANGLPIGDDSVASDDRTLEQASLSASAEPTDGDSLQPAWFVMAGGGALIVSAIAYDVANAHLIDDRDAASAANDLPRYNAIDEQIERGAVIDAVLYGVGAATVVGGLVWYLLDDDAPDAQLSAAPTRDGGAIVSGAWAF